MAIVSDSTSEGQAFDPSWLFCSDIHVQCYVDYEPPRRLSNNFEALASELLENLGETFPE